MEVGRAIKIFRDARGLKLGSLAERSGISIAHLSLIESGDREPSLGVLKRIAAELEVPLDSMLSILQPGEGTLRSSDFKSESLKAALDKLDDAESKLRQLLGEPGVEADRGNNAG